MRMSKLYMPTLREVPAEVEIPSHNLLLRGGMTRQLVSGGVYTYLPLGYRVIKKNRRYCKRRNGCCRFSGIINVCNST